MRIPVLIERVAGDGFRARGGDPLSLCAEGRTEEEAVARLRDLIEDRLAVGAKLISLDVGSADHPHAPIPGWDADDPLFDEWQEAMREYRRQVEDDPNRI
ncbi:hypothetical protein OJF2_00150 [Aquisphaera giovannonii]|uniref:Uncharacterized protein n=1 Tax=Aquisphaera giovannonii TaxID=406548 RepID=A0A5B9VUT2_9BACT|nr:hypothetical protein [Aquisphaera giovannonii]QEH31550.1 hypothetical protein OJF2_00150 [Aquisphaera giovannonii]